MGNHDRPVVFERTFALFRAHVTNEVPRKPVLAMGRIAADEHARFVERCAIESIGADCDERRPRELDYARLSSLAVDDPVAEVSRRVVFVENEPVFIRARNAIPRGEDCSAVARDDERQHRREQMLCDEVDPRARLGAAKSDARKSMVNCAGPDEEGISRRRSLLHCPHHRDLHRGRTENRSELARFARATSVGNYAARTPRTATVGDSVLLVLPQRRVGASEDRGSGDDEARCSW